MTRVSVVLLTLAVAAPLSAQGITGFSTASAVRELQLERRLQAVPDTTSARVYTRALSARPHVAGSPAQKATADYVLQRLAAWGLDTMRVGFRVYLPYHDSTIVERIAPSHQRLDLTEPPVAGDPTTQLPNQWPAMNGNSGVGDVTAPLVYVNYGLPSDYATLDSLGVSVKGKVAIVRYGRSFRGIKAREAEAHGAVGLLIYSDPQDDGFVRGAVYPEGPFRSAAGVQRGSIFNGNGDPTTPGWPSMPNEHRVPEDSLTVPHIPVVPISYGNAELLMHDMGGAIVPTGGTGSWQGGMKFTYHVGDSMVRARVAVWAERGERAFKNIYDTFGTIRGSEFPNEVIIVGAHRDAWGPGADDNVSGVVSVMEAAHAWATAVKAGLRPKRTLVFATWDAEEWGLVGSTEWVELMQDSLRAKAVAYLNQDESAAGVNFGAGGTASLQGMIRDVSKTVRQPGDTMSVYAKWTNAGGRGSAAAMREPRMGDLGGGSDFAGFYNYLGIPSFETGFGSSGGGAYHSVYDTYTHMEKFGDPGYLGHAAEGKMVAVLLARLANADILPFDYAALGAYLGTLVPRAMRGADSTKLTAEEAELLAATRELEAAGQRFNTLRDSVLKAKMVASTARAAVNRRLPKVEQKLTRVGGLANRPNMRNMVFASDRDNGYANIALPGIAEAIRDNDTERTRREIQDLTQRIRAAASEVRAAADGLSGKPTAP